jgi:hypothetical protein
MFQAGSLAETTDGDDSMSDEGLIVACLENDSAPHWQLKSASKTFNSLITVMSKGGKLLRILEQPC